MNDNAAIARTKRNEEVDAIRHSLLKSEVDIQAEMILAKWRKDNLGDDIPLIAAHSLISAQALASIILDELIKFSAGWKQPFPPRWPNGELMLYSCNGWEYKERARVVALDMLRSGELQATGRDNRQPLKKVKIPTDAWNAIIPNFDRSRAGNGATEFADVRVSVSAAKTHTDKRDRRFVATAKVRDWLTKRVERWPQGDPYPGEKADRIRAEADLRGLISRDTFRELRTDLVPAAWRRRGRPRKVAPPKAEIKRKTRGPYSRRN